MFRPDWIGHLQGDLYNVCSLCFNLTIGFSHTMKIDVVVYYVLNELKFLQVQYAVQYKIVKLQSCMLCPDIWLVFLCVLHCYENCDYGIQTLIITSRRSRKGIKKHLMGSITYTHQIFSVYCTHYLLCTALSIRWNFSNSFYASPWSYNQHLYSIVTVFITGNTRRKT